MDEQRAILVSIRIHVTVCAYALVVIALCAVGGLVMALSG